MESEKRKRVKRIIITGANTEIIQRYGSAVKEHIVSYSGVDNENGKQLVKSLKSINRQKVNPEYRKQNLKQQAGFSAEVKETANANAENIMKKTGKVKTRTDDMGRVNDPLYDHVEIDSAGNIIINSGSQMKFVGNSPKEALDKLASKKFSKYLENDVKIEVPKDYYQGIKKEAENKIKNLKEQLEKQIERGDTKRADELKKRIDDYERIKKNLRESSVSNKEAMFSRLHPRLSTAKSMIKVAHKAGWQAAGVSAAVGGSISFVQNIVSAIKGEEDIQEAVFNVGKDTLKTTVFGYGTGFAGATIKGSMQNASSDMVRNLSKTNLPATIVALSVGATKTFRQYYKGEITGVECFEALGEEGTGMISSALFATIGQAAIPIPILGGMIGSIVGYALSSASYNVLLSSLKEEKLAEERRRYIEEMCQEHITLIRQYRKEMELSINTYLCSYISLFQEAFSQINQSLELGDIDKFINNTNRITIALNKETLFINQEECDERMLNDSTIRF